MDLRLHALVFQTKDPLEVTAAALMISDETLREEAIALVREKLATYITPGVLDEFDAQVAAHRAKLGG